MSIVSHLIFGVPNFDPYLYIIYRLIYSASSRSNVITCNHIKYSLYRFYVYELQPKFRLMQSSIRASLFFRILEIELGLGKR